MPFWMVDSLSLTNIMLSIFDYRVLTETCRPSSLTTVFGPKHDVLCPWLPWLASKQGFPRPCLPCLDQNMSPFVLDYRFWTNTRRPSSLTQNMASLGIDYRVWTKTCRPSSFTIVSAPKYDAFRAWFSCLDWNIVLCVLDYRVWTKTWRSSFLINTAKTFFIPENLRNSTGDVKPILFSLPD